MKHRILLPALLLLLSACASSEDTSGPDWVPGIYTGNFTPNGGTAQPSVVMITTNNKALFTETDVQSTGLGTVSGDTVSFGAQAYMSLTEGLSGVFDFAGTAGNFSLASSDVYNHGSDSTRLQGQYIDSTNITVAGVTTWQFNNGAFSVTSSTGCSAYGTVTPIDTTYNEYSVNITIQSCADYDGIYTGLAFTDDTNTADDTINILVENATRTALIFSAPVRQ